MTNHKKLFILLAVLLTLSLACGSINFDLNGLTSTLEGALETTIPPTEAPPTPTPIVEGGYDPATASSDEPVLITGIIPFTSPFFINMTAEPFVLLEDQAGFVARDEEFAFPLAGQTIGPVWQTSETDMVFSLSLPSVPQGTLMDLDNDTEEETGVMVFQVAFWSNTWGGPFLEEREGTGWSGSYTSAMTDPERDYEISGGKLIIWAPDDAQDFPTGFGEDNMLFTEDDPTGPVPAGYSVVDLDTQPFTIYKEANPQFTLEEGAGEVKDFSEMSRAEAFDAMFERVRVEYPFTADKGIDWDALYDEFAPQVEAAGSSYEYYQILHNFTLRIPDGHVGLGITDDANQLFYDTNGSSFGMILKELSDGRVIVTRVYTAYAADRAGIEIGAEITQWDGQPIQDAIADVEPFFGPYSTEQIKRVEQVVFLTRYAPKSRIDVTFANPGESLQTVNLVAEVEYDSLFDAIPYYVEDPITLPVEAEVLPGNIGYMKISTFSDDYNLMAQVFEYHLEKLIDSDLNGLIIDLRVNLGGSGGLAANFAGYFIDEEIEVSQHAYYNHLLGEFEYGDEPATLEPGPMTYHGPIVALVSPYCVSACEGFAYWLTLNNRATIVGHFPTAGAFGEVGRGQYTLPGGIDMQVPTGRPETMTGDLLIEGTGVPLDITVPVTEESALGLEDTVLQAGIDYLLGN